MSAVFTQSDWWSRRLACYCGCLVPTVIGLTANISLAQQPEQPHGGLRDLATFARDHEVSAILLSISESKGVTSKLSGRV